MKFFKHILLAMFLFCSLSVLWACTGKEDAKITEIYFKSGSVATTVEQYSNYNTEGIVVIAKYDDGTEKELERVYFNRLSTQTVGEQTLTATYDGFTCSTVITVTEFSGERAYYIGEIKIPVSISNGFNDNSQKANAYTDQLAKGASVDKAGFVNTGKTYKVGNDNPFKFSPAISVVYFDEDRDTEDIHNYPIHADVYLYNGTSYELIGEQDLANYVTIDRDNHTFQFKNDTSVEGKKFKIEVRPDFDLIVNENGPEGGREQAVDTANNRFKSVSFEFEVVDGWNAYTAADLSLIDNSNDEGKWDALKDKWGLNDKITNAIILHNNIFITKEDVPSIHFYSDTNTDGVEGDALNKVKGYMINEDGYDAESIVYKRVIADGKSFNIEGNYFQISVAGNEKIGIDHMPLVNAPKWKADDVAVVCTALFGFVDNEAITQNIGSIDLTEETCTINNVAFIGNCKKAEETGPAGMVCYKTENVNFTIDNCLSQAWYIAHFFEGSSVGGGEEVLTETSVRPTQQIINCTTFDCYNTILYCQGARDVVIENSYLIGAGGPVMICDEETDEYDETEDGVDYNNDGDKADKDIAFHYPTNVKVKDSTLQSWVVGSEAWFTSAGATGIVSGLQAMNNLLVPLGSTILSENADHMAVINLIAVYKDSDTAGITECNINATFTDVSVDDKGTEDTADDERIYDFGLTLSSTQEDTVDQTRNQVAADIIKMYGGDMNAASKVLENMGILQGFNGTIAVPGVNSFLVPPMNEYQPGVTTFQPGYLNVHLFNGMAAVLGIK